MIKYLLSGRDHSDRHIIKACKQHHPLLYRIYLDNNIFSSYTKLTYGYLGRFAHTLVNQRENHHYPIIDKIYIFDHPFVPNALKNSIYRVSCFTDGRLRTIDLNSDTLVTDKHKNTIYNYIKDKQLETSITMYAVEASSGASKFAVFVSPSPVLLAINDHIFSSKSHRHLFSKLIADYACADWLVCSKQTEALVDKSGMSLKRENTGVRRSIDYSEINFVYCPSSLLAFNYILHKIPTMVSPLHPYCSSLQNLHALSSNDLAEIIYLATIRSSVSLQNIKKLGWHLT